MSSLSQQMAEFAHGLRVEEIPGEVIHAVKRFLLDSLGCALAAFRNEDMQAVHRTLEELGGREQASVIGSGLRTNAANAALMNCLLVRALDYNDIYWVQDPSHPSDLIGVALAAAEANDRAAVEALLAIVIAYELEMRWCHAAQPGIREVGWHHATLTQFVSPLVAGRLYGLDVGQLTAAVGISGSSHFTLGAVVAGHLTNMKNTADPLAAQAGIHAALMARQGCGGPVEILEGKEGLFEVVSNVRWRPEELVNGLGAEFMLPRCSFKAFPTEALTHQPISAALRVCREHGITHRDVEELLVETTSRGADILSDPSKYQPKTKETADHSLPYVIAVAVVDGNVLPESFSQDKLQDPAIWELLPKIKVVADPEIDSLFPKIKRARVTIRTVEGTSHTAQTDVAKGDPADPMSDSEIEAKFRANAAGTLSRTRMEEVIGATWQFDALPSVGAYMGRLTSDLNP